MNTIALNVARTVFMVGLAIGLYGFFWQWPDPQSVTVLCVIAIGIKVLFVRPRGRRTHHRRNPGRGRYGTCAAGHRDLDEDGVCRTCGILPDRAVFRRYPNEAAPPTEN